MEEKIISGTHDVLRLLMEESRLHSAEPMTAAVMAAYALLKAQDASDDTELVEILANTGVPENLQRFVRRQIGERWDRYLQMRTNFSRDDLKAFFSTSVRGECFGRMYESSSPVIDLASRLLELTPEDSVCDMGCGVGDFILNAATGADARSGEPLRVGFELLEERAAIAAMRTDALGLPVSIRPESVFVRRHLKVKYDKVFCDAPYADRQLATDPEVEACVRAAFPDFPKLTPGMAAEWLFAARAVAGLKPNGRAAVLMMPTAMFDGRNEPYRRYFVSKHLVEAVIELPPSLFVHTGVVRYLVLFRAGCDSVKLVDLNGLQCGDTPGIEPLYNDKRRNKEIGQGHIEVIAACLGRTAVAPEVRTELDAYRIEVPMERLLEKGNECVMTPRRYVKKMDVLKESVPLGNFLSSARRCPALSAKELNELVSEEDTGVLYMVPRDIGDGDVVAGLAHLGKLPERLGPYLVQSGDIVIARTMACGDEFRSVVVEVPDGKKIVPSGNLLVLTVDADKSDPYFIKSCLDSAYAKRYLDSNTVGTALRTLNYRTLENLPIPNLPLARQQEIGAACRATIKRIRKLGADLAAERFKLAHMLETQAADCFRADSASDASGANA